MKKPSYIFVIFLLLGVITIMLWHLSLGLLAYLSGALATAAFIWLSTLLASPFQVSHISLTVLKALIYTLQHDPNPGVRSKAAVGLAELELEQEQPSYHHDHDKLDHMLFE